VFDAYLRRWELVPDGDPILTRSSRLLPVQQHGVPAMLKVAVEAEEKFGHALMTWWDGHGAARVLAHDGDALLLERAEGKSLVDLAAGGRDDEATRVICSVVAKLHAPRSKPLPNLIPLSRWFRQLEPAAAAHGAILSACAATARELLASPRDIGVLHGDIHHGNILDFGARGWLAIDPKGLHGERGFDYANLFCNPDTADPTRPVATVPHHFASRVEVVSREAGLERRRLLQWILAWAGLSAAWFLGDGISPETDFKIAELAAAELNR
jgi:streptomycin 6-kinase